MSLQLLNSRTHWMGVSRIACTLRDQRQQPAGMR